MNPPDHSSLDERWKAVRRPAAAEMKPRRDGAIQSVINNCVSFSFHAGRARLRRALTFSHEIESRLDRVSPYQNMRNYL